MKRRRPSSVALLKLLPLVVLAMMVGACASMGRPEGGPRDVEPPVFVRSTPAPGAVMVEGRKIVVEFDENVQLDNPQDKIVVSPAQRVNPAITSNGRRITVELRDTLLPNTTYTIDFADAIKDLNEGNVLDGFAIDFSTGPEVDSLRISGMVFEAATLEPAQGMLVGAYLDRGDTAILTTPFDRITKTNQLGQFTLRNLKPGSYRVYALKDNNRDFHWDRSEDVAFLDSMVVPGVTVADSLTSFYPNDLILTWFNEDYRAQYLKEYSRPDARRLQFVLGAPTDTLPRLRVLDGPAAGEDIARLSRLTASHTLDSLTYWLTDERLTGRDSLLLEATYQRLDSAERLVWRTDTLKLNLRRAKADKKKAERKASAADTTDAEGPELLALKSLVTPRLDLNLPLRLSSDTPVDSIDNSLIRLEMMVDTLWVDAPAQPRFALADTLQPFLLTAPMTWEPGKKYRLTVDSLAVTDIYGVSNKRTVSEFVTAEPGDYSALYFVVSGLEGPAFVQLLSAQDAPVMQAPVGPDGVAALEYIQPGTYYARLIADRNDNGRWDTGSLADSLQPEEVYYYPKPLALKKNWDVEQTWDIYATALDLQKPQAVKKNKPPMKAGERPVEETPDDLYGDDPTANQWGEYTNPFDPSARRNTPRR